MMTGKDVVKLLRGYADYLETTIERVEIPQNPTLNEALDVLAALKPDESDLSVSVKLSLSRGYHFEDKPPQRNYGFTIWTGHKSYSGQRLDRLLEQVRDAEKPPTDEQAANKVAEAIGTPEPVAPPF